MLTERHGCRRLSSRLSAVVAIWAGLAAADAAAQGSFEMDRAALEALYDATGGPTWVNSTNWKTSAPLGEWYGVETDADGRVTQLVLMENGLTGPIPAALASLVNLETLDLRNNGLTGPIPVALASLVNLEWLQLGGNALTGPIPATLASLVNLKKLDLWGNALTGPIPDWLGSLVNLERLSFSRNALSGPIPDALANLVNLEALYLVVALESVRLEPARADEGDGVDPIAFVTVRRVRQQRPAREPLLELRLTRWCKLGERHARKDDADDHRNDYSSHSSFHPDPRSKGQHRPILRDRPPRRDRSARPQSIDKAEDSWVGGAKPPSGLAGRARPGRG